jgi:hypothetical protein
MFDKKREELSRGFESSLGSIDVLASRRFKKAIVDLAKRIEVTFGNDPDVA